MIKKIVDQMLGMCDLAYKVFRSGLIISCGMLLCAVALLIYIDGYNGDTYDLLYYVSELSSLPAGIMLIGTIASVCIEDFNRNGK